MKALKGWPITLRGDITEIISPETFRKMFEAHEKKMQRPGEARKALIRAGILTKTGRIAKRYR